MKNEDKRLILLSTPWMPERLFINWWLRRIWRETTILTIMHQSRSKKWKWFLVQLQKESTKNMNNQPTIYLFILALLISKILFPLDFISQTQHIALHFTHAHNKKSEMMLKLDWVSEIKMLSSLCCTLHLVFPLGADTLHLYKLEAQRVEFIKINTLIPINTTSQLQ